MADERLRLFAALELPRAARDTLVRWRDQALGRDRELRPLSIDSLHATLCFLGWRPADELDAIAAACSVLSAEPGPVLSLGAARWLPPRRPRVLAVKLLDRSGALTRAQMQLSEVLAAGGWYEPEKRPYLPHVTVARAGRHARASRAPLPSPPALEFRARRVTLYRSRLSRTGARYEPLASTELVCSETP
jgi:2'-5' RNA ligase